MEYSIEKDASSQSVVGRSRPEQFFGLTGSKTGSMLLAKRRALAGHSNILSHKAAMVAGELYRFNSKHGTLLSNQVASSALLQYFASVEYIPAFLVCTNSGCNSCHVQSVAVSHKTAI